VRCAFLIGVRPDRNEVNFDVTIKGLLLFLLAFVAGYFVALFRERIVLRREQNAGHPTLSSGAVPPVRAPGAVVPDLTSPTDIKPNL
jgi:hypothetical protein